MADEDSWLYGEEGGGEENEGEELKEVEEATVQDEPMGEESQATTTTDAGDEPMEEGGGGEGGGEGEEEDEEDSDSEGEDGVNVIIDQKRIEEDKTKTIQSMQIKQSQREGGVNKSKKQGTFAVEDFDAIGSITVNGQTSAAVELDMESLEEKPWRKPGADITDYFNYGFSEDTWAAYCNRQRRLRVNESGAGLTSGSAIVTQNRTAGPLTGSIPILGGSSADKLSGPPPSRKELEPSGIQVMTHEKRVYPSKVLGNMDFSVPPPGFDPTLPPPTGGPPPPDLSGPPPSGEFPPSDPFGEYSEVDPYSGGYEPTASAQWSAPPPGYGGEGESGGYPGERYGRRRDSREDRYRERDYDRREGDRSRRRRSRSRSRERERSDRDRRDRGDRHGDRDRDRDEREKKVKKEKRSRSRSRSRSRKKSKKEKKSDKEREEESSSRGERGESKENRDKSDAPAKVTVISGVRVAVKEEPKE